MPEHRLDAQLNMDMHKQRELAQNRLANLEEDVAEQRRIVAATSAFIEAMEPTVKPAPNVSTRIYSNSEIAESAGRH